VDSTMDPPLATTSRRICRDHASLRGRRITLVTILAGIIVAHVFCHVFSSSVALVAGRFCRLPRCIDRVGASTRVKRQSRGGDAQPSFRKGDRVKALHDGIWYPGVIERRQFDGRFSVRWDEPDDGLEASKVEPEFIQKFVAYQDYTSGDDVMALCPEDGKWYPGTVVQGHGDGTFQVKWDDADGGPETHDIHLEAMMKVCVRTNYKINDEVVVKHTDEPRWGGTVVAVNEDGTFVVEERDSDGETVTCSPKDMKLSVSMLEVGQKHTGYVSSICDMGAWVDICAGHMGLLHISRVSKGWAREMRDHVTEGQRVDVWISGIGSDGQYGVSLVEGRLGGGRAEGEGSLKRGDVAPFAKVDPQEWFIGVVRTIVYNGAFVSVTLPGGARADGFMHISSIQGSRNFIKEGSVDQEFEIGQEVRVRIQSVDIKAAKMSVSMKDYVKPRKPPPSAAVLAPFEGISNTEWLTGTVKKIKPFGAFVAVQSPSGDNSAEGLLHVKDILEEGFLKDVKDELEVGQEVRVRIQSMDVEAGKMRLSMKGFDSHTENQGSRHSAQDLASFEGISDSEWLAGTVERIKPFGAFVRVQSPSGDSSAEGLLHVKYVSEEGFVDDIRDYLEVGQEVQVRILELDLAQGRLSFSMQKGAFGW